VEIEGRANIQELSGFREGCFEVQEEASQLVALMTDALPGQAVAEIGAGAGGKSLALAAMMDNRGSLLAVDTSAVRLERLEKRAARSGATIVKPLTIGADELGVWQLSASKQRTIYGARQSMDCVLVDAPCSGSGVLRRSPDIKWRADDQEAFARLQTLLLEQSAQLVARSGCLVYATCAFESAQNEAVVERFLHSAHGAEFTVQSALPALTNAVQRLRIGRADGDQSSDLGPLFSGPFLRSWPSRHGLDAFFGARLVRR